MSISSAPFATASEVSAIFTSSNDWLDGKAPDTHAIFTPDTSSTVRTTAAKLGYTQIAATLGSDGKSSSKLFTASVNFATDEGESVLLSVVRSMQLRRVRYTSLLWFSAKCSSSIFFTASATVASLSVTVLCAIACSHLIQRVNHVPSLKFLHLLMDCQSQNFQHQSGGIHVDDRLVVFHI